MSLLWGVLFVSGCERPSESQQAAPPGAPTTSPAPDPALVSQADSTSDTYQVKLAALRHLVGEQPLENDRRAFVAYVVKDSTAAEAASLADALSLALAGRGPRVVAAQHIELYTRKGRTMDAASGRPVKVFQVRVENVPTPAGPAAGEVRAAARVSWQSGRLAGETSRYQLARGAEGWRVIERTAEAP